MVGKTQIAKGKERSFGVFEKEAAQPWPRLLFYVKKTKQKNLRERKRVNAKEIERETN